MVVGWREKYDTAKTEERSLIFFTNCSPFTLKRLSQGLSWQSSVHPQSTAEQNMKGSVFEERRRRCRGWAVINFMIHGATNCSNDLYPQNSSLRYVLGGDSVHPQSAAKPTTKGLQGFEGLREVSSGIQLQTALPLRL